MPSPAEAFSASLHEERTTLGLGVLINIANQGLFDTPLMFVALVALACIGLTFYGLVVLVERRLVSR